MESIGDFEIHLWEDQIELDEQGRLVHHPLNGRYSHTDGRVKRDFGSQGYLSFAGHDLDMSEILSDIRVFHLWFYGAVEDSGGREEWADPLRAIVLNRLTGKERSWYLGRIDGPLVNPAGEVEFLGGRQLPHAIVQYEKRRGYGSLSKPFLEAPNALLTDIVLHFWDTAVPGYPLEGYNMAPGRIDRIVEWDKKPRNDLLLREVIDEVYIAFYTFPAENRDFVFLTNKLELDELAEMVGLEDLQRRAKDYEASRMW